MIAQIKKFLTLIIAVIQSSKFFGPRLDQLLFWWYFRKGYAPNENLLNQKEKQVLDSRRKALFGTNIVPDGLKVVFALIGEPGSGKSMIAKQMECRKGLVIVSADAVRIELRNLDESYVRVQEICNILTLVLISQGYSVVLESSHIDPFKRAKLRVFLARSATNPSFLQVTCDDDVAIKRIVEGEYGPDSLYDNNSPKLGGLRGSKLFLAERARQMFLYQDRKGRYRHLSFLCQEPIDTSQVFKR